MKVKEKLREEEWSGIQALLIVIVIVIVIFLGIAFIYEGFTTMLETGPVANASPPLSRERLDASVGLFGGLIIGVIGLGITAVGVTVLVLTIFSQKKNLL